NFFSQATLTTAIYTLSLHDALPIYACLSTEGVYCSRCVYYGKHQSFQATAGFRDYAPNAYSSSNGNLLLLGKIGVFHNRRNASKIGRAVQQECRDRSRMPSSA